LITRLAERSPLKEAGAEEGAVLSHFGGELIHSPESLLELIDGRETGEHVEVRYANSDNQWHEETIQLYKPGGNLRGLHIPLIFHYERTEDGSETRIPLLLFKREKFENSAKYRLLWFFRWEVGESDELLEVQPF
jgi:hypothetical protein